MHEKTVNQARRPDVLSKQDAAFRGLVELADGFDVFFTFYR